nr:hypothetical protein [Aquicoccus sp. G2-2]MEA1112991.1 hypothetical protein [Aquicoccus sp. G2-2]
MSSSTERVDISALIAAELYDYDPDAGNLRTVGQVAPMSPVWHRKTISEFRAAMIEPEEVEVLFCGGMVETCFAVTRSDGAYRVIYIPWAGLFSLAVESKYGPVDIGVHGDAVSVFGTVH